MLLLFLIIVTSLTGFVVTWLAAGGLATDGGNPVLAALVAFLIALLWAWGHQRLEEDYLNARFDRVRRWLALWGSSMGAMESVMLRLWLAVEGRDDAELKRGLAGFEERSTQVFAKAWALGHRARLDGKAEKALGYYEAGAQATGGVDRAELLSEAALLDLQIASIAPGTAARGRRRDALDRGLVRSEEADGLLRTSDMGLGGRKRLQYVAALRGLVRALLYMLQGRPPEALTRLLEIEQRTRYMHSMRARRLRHAAAIERIGVLRVLGRSEEATLLMNQLRSEIKLPELRQRLGEIAAAVRRDEREESEVMDRPEHVPSAAPSRHVSDQPAATFGQLPEGEPDGPMFFGFEEDEDAGDGALGAAAQGVPPSEPIEHVAPVDSEDGGEGEGVEVSDGSGGEWAEPHEDDGEDEQLRIDGLILPEE